MTYNKILCFEYILFKLLEWFKEEKTPEERTNDFTRLKSLKLLFFVSTIQNNDKEDLLNIFNRFYAMEYGPVESDIYTAMLKDTTTIYSFKSSFHVIEKKTCINLADFNGLPKEIIQHIDNSINSLKKENKDLVYYSSSRLIKISHKWKSWNDSITVASFLNKGSMLMEVEDIRKNKQFFSL